VSRDPDHGLFKDDLSSCSRLGLATINLQTKHEVINYSTLTTIYEDTKSVEIGVVCGGRGHTRSSAIRYSACDFLFDFNRNCAFILYRFRDTVSYLSKVSNLTHPTCIWRPCRGCTRSNFADIFGVRKLDRVPEYC